MPGLANFTAAMLDEGTTTRNALAIADEAARLGATLITASTMDQIQMSVTSLARAVPARAGAPGRRRPPADVPAGRGRAPAREPARDSGAQKSNPSQIASRVMAAALFGPAHPYGYIDLGTEASNKAMTRDAMLDFWKQQLVPGNAALVVVGAVSRRERRGADDEGVCRTGPGRRRRARALPAPRGTARS